MAIVDLLMPKMGESIMEATILKWHKQPGDTVQQDETLLDIATDKVDSEVPSTAAGTLEEILFQVNAVVPVGAVIARIKTDVAEPAGEAPHPQAAAERKETAAPEEKPDSPYVYTANQESGSAQQTAAPVGSDASKTNGNGARFYSPLVLNIAGNEGIPVTELEQIPGTGNEGRVTKKDILQYVSQRKEGNGSHSGAAPGQTGFARPQEAATASGVYSESAAESADAAQFNNTGGNTEIQEMDRMRKLIADHMVRSKQTSPHVTSFSEADVTNLVLWRENEKAAFEKREGTKLTLTPLFIEAVVKCIKKFPLINSSVDGDKIIIRKNIHIGMATALPSGSLIVPVIKNADNFNRVGLARQVNELAGLARSNKLKPEDIQDGTFTITNVGVFGSLMGTPIINQPQVAILAVGAIKKRPVVIETEQGDAIGIRHMMYLSMSYDHRIIDGSLGASFLAAVAKELEGFSA
jgi:2-oxoglutarate dehydrogenase E2 component (dihydrolipoamide succinyltransferase)